MTGKAFSKYQFGLNAGYTNPDNNIKKYWQSNHNIEGFFVTPFYYGNLLFGAKYLPLNKIETEQPDINCFYIHIGWNATYNVVKSIFVFAGLKAGSFLMLSDVSEISTYQRSEMELGFGPYAGLNLKLSENIVINLSGEYFQVFTKNKMNFLTLSAGISLEYTSPKWLRDFLN